MGGGAGEDPGGGGDRAGEGLHGAGDVAGDADLERRGGDAAAGGAGEGLGGGHRAGGALGAGGDRAAHAEPAGRELGGGRGGGAGAGGGVAQRAGEAAGGGGLVVAGVAGPLGGGGRVLGAEDLLAALPARLRAAFSAARWAALPGGKAGGGARSAATSAAISLMASAMASASSEGISMMTGAGGGVSGSMPRMRHQRRASLARVRASSSAVCVELAPGGAQALERAGAGDGLDLGLDQGGLAGVEDPGVAPGEDQGGGGAGLAGGRGCCAGGGEVVEDELGDGGAQPAAVAGAAGDLAALDPGLFQLVGGLAPGGALGRGLAGQGVGGVRALVGEGAPEGGVAVPVRGKAGAAVAGGDPEEVAVDLDDREPGMWQAGVPRPGAGGAGDRDGAAGDRGDLGGQGVRQRLPVAGGGGEPGGGGGGGGGAVADMAGGPFRSAGRGLELAAEGEGGDRRAAEGLGEGGGYDVAVLLGADPGEVGDGGVLAEDAGDPGVGEELAELGCPADLALGLAGGEVAGGADRAGVDLEAAGEVVVGGDLDLDREPAGKGLGQDRAVDPRVVAG